MVVVLLSATFVLAYLLHEWVERPFYQRGGADRPRPLRVVFIPGSVSAMLLLAALGLQISASDGWAWRRPNALTADQVEQGKQRRYTLWDVNCSIENLAAPACHMERPLQVLFVGNSHELDALNEFRAAFGDNDGINFIKFGTFNGCELHVRNGLPTTDVKSRHCKERLATLFDKDFVSRLDVVVYGSYRPFSHTKGPSFLLLKHLRDMNEGIKFVVVGGYFRSDEPCSEIVARFGTADPCKARKAFFDERAESKLPEKKSCRLPLHRHEEAPMPGRHGSLLQS